MANYENIGVYRFQGKKYAKRVIECCNLYDESVYENEEQKTLSLRAKREISYWAETETEKEKIIKKIHELMSPEEVNIIDKGSEIIIKKNDDDYAIIDRIYDKKYRVKNGVKRENKTLQSFSNNVNHHSIYTNDDVIKILIKHIKHNHTTSTSGIIETLGGQEIQKIEKWLRLDPQGYNKKASSAYGYKIIIPRCEPKDISKGIRKELTKMDLICEANLINDIHEYGLPRNSGFVSIRNIEKSDKIKQEQYFNTFKTIYDYLNKEENYRLLLSNSRIRREEENIIERMWDLNKLIRYIIKYQVNTKSFCSYMSKLSFTEGLNINQICNYYPDYIKLEYELCDGRTSKMKKYPNYLATMHDKNVTLERLKNYDKYERIHNKEELFKESTKIIEQVEYNDKEYCVIIPQKPEDIIEEGIDNMNCVGSYVSDIINNRTNIVFIRKTEHPDKSYITCEISNNMKIVQILRGNNKPLEQKDKDFVKKWADEKKLIYK